MHKYANDNIKDKQILWHGLLYNLGKPLKFKILINSFTLNPASLISFSERSNIANLISSTPKSLNLKYAMKQRNFTEKWIHNRLTVYY